MKKIIFAMVLLFLSMTNFLCSADIREDSKLFDEWLAKADSQFDDIRYGDADSIGDPLPQENWDFQSGLVFALFNIFDDQKENSLEAAGKGNDFYGIPNSWLAKDLSEAEKVILLQQVSVSSSSLAGRKNYIYAKLVLVDPAAGEILQYTYTPSVYLTPEENDAFNITGVQSCTDFLINYAEKRSHPDGYKDRYDKAMALFNDERYYSAQQAFIESQYGDWEAYAEKCIRQNPSAGELWHDPSIWVKDMYLTFQIDQPADTSSFIRLYKDGSPVSYLFVLGTGKVTVELPGDGYYTIKDGIGNTWYGVKEAFGPEGSYETMTFDDSGTEKIYLKSYYEYTISINIGGGGTGIGSKEENWDAFAE
ncbi:MAG: hypothetical protein IKP86_05875 [Anaerolineaceae bacterium]|nr:hypothetical protein [Anaerolineaceae bacterium]